MSGWVRCPRCEAAMIRDGAGALSRTTRDDGPPVTVCDRCGEREGLYGRDPEKQVSIKDWPVAIDVLMDEEWNLISRARESDFGLIPADRIEP